MLGQALSLRGCERPVSEPWGISFWVLRYYGGTYLGSINPSLLLFLSLGFGVSVLCLLPPLSFGNSQLFLIHRHIADRHGILNESCLKSHHVWFTLSQKTEKSFISNLDNIWSLPQVLQYVQSFKGGINVDNLWGKCTFEGSWFLLILCEDDAPQHSETSNISNSPCHVDSSYIQALGDQWGPHRNKARAPGNLTD